MNTPTETEIQARKAKELQADAEARQKLSAQQLLAAAIRQLEAVLQSSIGNDHLRLTDALECIRIAADKTNK
jgi:hypothetical protein